MATTSARRQADEDATYAARRRKREKRYRENEALKMVDPTEQNPATMSEADRNTAARRIKFDRGTVMDQGRQGPMPNGSTLDSLGDPTQRTQIMGVRRNPAAEGAANAAVAGSMVPMNINSPQRSQDAAILASPVAPVTPTGPGTMGRLMATNRAQAQGRAGMADPTQASVGMGRTLTAAQSEALMPLQPTPGNLSQTPYGTASVRMVQPGEQELQGPPVPSESGLAGVGTVPAITDEERRADLYLRHPNIFVPNSPENIAFQARSNELAAKHGKATAFQLAHAEADDLMAQIKKAPAGGRGGSSATLASLTQAAEIPKNALVDPKSTLGMATQIVAHPVSAINAVGERIGGQIKSAGRKALTAVGVIPKGVATIKGGLDAVDRWAGLKPPLSPDPTQQPPPQIAPSQPAPVTQPPAIPPAPQSPNPVAETPEEKARKKRMQQMATAGA